MFVCLKLSTINSKLQQQKRTAQMAHRLAISNLFYVSSAIWCCHLHHIREAKRYIIVYIETIKQIVFVPTQTQTPHKYNSIKAA